jgi:hypothetical protein
MNGDLLLLRKRWWGAWLIIASAAFCLTLFLTDALKDGLRMDFIGAGLCAVIIAVCYAPWTFFWMLRVIGLILCLGSVAFLIDSVWNGKSVTAALHAVSVFGVPGALVAWLRLPSVCPYDERGRLIPIEVVRNVRLLRDPGTHATAWGWTVVLLVPELRLSRRERRSIARAAGRPAELIVRQLIGAEAQAFPRKIARATRRARRALRVGAEQLTPTTFRTRSSSACGCRETAPMNDALRTLAPPSPARRRLTDPLGRAVATATADVFRRGAARAHRRLACCSRTTAQALGGIGRSVYVGAEIAQIPLILTEHLVLCRRVEWLNVDASPTREIARAIGAVSARLRVDLPRPSTREIASVEPRSCDHLWMASVLTDPDHFPALHDALYERAGSELATRRGDLADDRRRADALVGALLDRAANSCVLTTTILTLVAPIAARLGLDVDLARWTAFTDADDSIDRTPP